MTQQELEVYARIRFHRLIKDIKDQSTIELTVQEAIRLMGIPELIEQTEKEICESTRVVCNPFGYDVIGRYATLQKD